MRSAERPRVAKDRSGQRRRWQIGQHAQPERSSRGRGHLRRNGLDRREGLGPDRFDRILLRHRCAGQEALDEPAEAQRAGPSVGSAINRLPHTRCRRPHRGIGRREHNQQRSQRRERDCPSIGICSYCVRRFRHRLVCDSLWQTRHRGDPKAASDRLAPKYRPQCPRRQCRQPQHPASNPPRADILQTQSSVFHERPTVAPPAPTQVRTPPEAPRRCRPP